MLNHSRLKDALNNREREITSLRRQMDAAHDELAEVGRSREIALRENRRLQDDLATMTRENQVKKIYNSQAMQLEEVFHGIKCTFLDVLFNRKFSI